MKHTPGPWHVASDPGGIIVTNLIGPIVARVSNTANAQAEANARLIATAPTLLKGIKLALMEFERISYQKKADPKIIELLKSAIAKAEGEL